MPLPCTHLYCVPDGIEPPIQIGANGQGARVENHPSVPLGYRLGQPCRRILARLAVDVLGLCPLDGLHRILAYPEAIFALVDGALAPSASLAHALLTQKSYAVWQAVVTNEGKGGPRCLV